MAKKKAEPQQPDRLAELEAKLGVLEKELLKAKAENKDLREQVSELSTYAPQPKPDPTADAPRVSFGKTGNYLVVHGVFHAGTRYTREQLAKNKELSTALIEAGSTALVRV